MNKMYSVRRKTLSPASARECVSLSLSLTQILRNVPGEISLRPRPFPERRSGGEGGSDREQGGREGGRELYYCIEDATGERCRRRRGRERGRIVIGFQIR